MIKAMGRLFQVANTLARYRLDQLLPSTPKGLQLLLLCLPGRWTRTRHQSDPERLRKALESLGPIYIKLGQMLSTRPDLLSVSLAEELAQLQDNVPGFPVEQAIQIIETDFQKPMDQLFSHFDHKPLAAASVAQVHTAILLDGTKVVVKIIRPDIKAIVERDISLMKLIARFLEQKIPYFRKFHLLTVVNDYERIILNELSLIQEANNTQQLRRNFHCSPLLYVPIIQWPLVSERVMVAERIYGVPISDRQALEAAGVDMEKLARRGVEIFFTQVFRDNFFHADMHPGNIYVSIHQPNSPQYIALDCAIIGTLSKHDQLLLARQLMALLQKDFEKLAELLASSGWVPVDVNIQEFAFALRATCEPIFDKPLNEIEFGPILVNLFRTARQFEIEALPQYVLLEKTVLHIEGLGRQIYPELDIWEIGQPLLENWLRDQLGPEAILTEIKRNIPLWIEQLPTLPQLAYDTLTYLKHNTQADIAMKRAQTQQVQTAKGKTIARRRQRIAGIILIGSAIAAISPEATLSQLALIPPISWVLMIAGIICLWPKQHPS